MLMFILLFKELFLIHFFSLMYIGFFKMYRFVQRKGLTNEYIHQSYANYYWNPSQTNVEFLSRLKKNNFQ